MSAFRLILFRIFFFSQAFLSRTLKNHRTAGDGRGPSIILLYRFHPLTNIQIFATLQVRWLSHILRWLSHIFNCNACIYQASTRWDLPPYWITIWLIGDVMLIFVCLLVDLILGFTTAIRHEKPVYSNLHWLSSLYYKRTDQPSVDRLFPHSDWIWTRITWNTDTFHAVIIVQLHNGVSDTTWYYGRWNTVFRCSFKIQPNIYDGVFLGK